MNQTVNHRLLEEIYATTVLPERFEDLLSTWEQHLYGPAESASGGAMDQPEVRNHLRRAAKMFDQIWMANSTASGDHSAPTIGGYYPWLECNTRGQILKLNASAQSRYSLNIGAAVTDLPFDPNDLKFLSNKIAYATAEPATESLVVSCLSVDGNRSTVISIMRLGPDRVRLTTNDLAWSPRLKSMLRNAFKLSTAECEILQLLAEGMNATSIAESRASAVPTVRAQIRAIYEKTGAHNQPELLRLALGVATLIEDVQPQVSEEPNGYGPKSHQENVLKLRDGRQLAYADFAAPSGTPVLFLHDEYYGYMWPQNMIEYARARRLRVLAPARGGYGGSDRYPSGVDSTEQFCSDVTELLDFLGVDEVIVLARRTGFRFAVALAHRNPERVRGIVAQSPALPADSIKRYQGMSRFARFISVAVFRNPTLLAFLVRAGFHYAEAQGLRAFARVLNKGSELDLALVDDPDIWPVLEAGLTFTGKNGYYAYHHDVRHDPLQTWRQTIAAPLPIHCLIGAHDPNDRLNRAQALIAAGANLTLQTIPESGQLFFYTQPEAVIDAVLERCG